MARSAEQPHAKNAKDAKEVECKAFQPTGQLVDVGAPVLKGLLMACLCGLRGLCVRMLLPLSGEKEGTFGERSVLDANRSGGFNGVNWRKV